MYTAAHCDKLLAVPRLERIVNELRQLMPRCRQGVIFQQPRHAIAPQIRRFRRDTMRLSRQKMCSSLPCTDSAVVIAK